MSAEKEKFDYEEWKRANGVEEDEFDYAEWQRKVWRVQAQEEARERREEEEEREREAAEEEELQGYRFYPAV
jgi:hypothetical protein